MNTVFRICKTLDFNIGKTQKAYHNPAMTENKNTENKTSIYHDGRH